MQVINDPYIHRGLDFSNGVGGGYSQISMK